MGTDNNGLKSFTDLVAHLNKVSEEAELPRRPKGPRKKKVVDSDRWTKLVHPEPIRSIQSPRQPVFYTELPAQMRVSQLPIRLFQGEFNGRPQWQGQYRLYHKGDHLDHIDVVVNVPWRFDYLMEGAWYWVRPTTMAPKKRLVFAELIREIDHAQDDFSRSWSTSSHDTNPPAPKVEYDNWDKDAHSAPQDYWDAVADYEAEVRANSEPPDYRDYDY